MGMKLSTYRESELKMQSRLAPSLIFHQQSAAASSDYSSCLGQRVSDGTDYKLHTILSPVCLANSSWGLGGRKRMKHPIPPPLFLTVTVPRAAGGDKHSSSSFLMVITELAECLYARPAPL